MEQQQKHRPLGVTIIAVLTIIAGIAFLASGITAATIAPFLLGPGVNNNSMLTPVVSAVTGIGLLILGIAYFVMAYGLLKAKGWAWTVTVVLSCIGIALGFVSIVTGHIGSIVSVVINGLILYYIYRPNVKSFFGKTTTTTAATASMTR
ncbi:MAG TPA: hypothetical protein VE089_10160 [Nitrososphaeraceae archaeon]|jgi:uncharacterized membrane protein HdeD (DUF308 family)|nr:hypothetical protein [Nitrososphaeraceae archaeon]